LTATSSRNVGFDVSNIASTTGMSPLPSANMLRQRRTVTMGSRVQSYTEIDISKWIDLCYSHLDDHDA
jgi:hypothetical protein